MPPPRPEGSGTHPPSTMPWCAFPRRGGCARNRVLDPGRVEGRPPTLRLASSNRGEIDDDPVERSSLPSLPELDHRATRSRRGDQLVVMVSSSRTSVECWACPGGAQSRRGSSLLPSLTDHFL